MTETRNRSRKLLLRAATCFAVLMVLTAGYLLRQVNILFNPILWACIQVIAVFLSSSIAANVLVRYLGTSDRTSLIFGTGFGLCGILQLAGVFEFYFRVTRPAEQPQISPSLLSWMVGQTLLGLLLFITVRVEKWLPWPREKKKVVFGVLCGVAAAGYLTTVSYLAWPREWSLRSTGFLPRPADLIPAILFLCAAVVLNRRIDRDLSVFDGMLPWVAGLNAASHLVASQSANLLDAPAMASQVINAASLAVLFGATLLDTVKLFHEVHDHATRDSLTGLANYRRFIDAVQGELERSGRTGRHFTLLLMDLDGLKEINDTYGHLTGTRAICRVSELLRLSCRSIDTAARYGGDEFALVLPETDEVAARQAILRIKKNLTTQDEEPQLTISIGAATYPQNGATVQQLLVAADRELYAMKSRSKKLRNRQQMTLGL